jgi:hypothetical protein
MQLQLKHTMKEGYHTDRHTRPLPGSALENAAILGEAKQLVARAITRKWARFLTPEECEAQAARMPAKPRGRIPGLTRAAIVEAYRLRGSIVGASEVARVSDNTARYVLKLEGVL